MAWEDAIQLSENIQYPDGYNAITVEGTGDEGGIETFGIVALTVTPGSVTSDGIQLFNCIAQITDPNDPNAGQSQLLEETSSASSPYETSVGKNIDQAHPVRVWYDVGNGTKGVEITDTISKIEDSTIYFSSPLSQIPLVMEYWGRNVVSFDTSNPDLEREHLGEDDYQLPTISGKFDPSGGVPISNNVATCTFTPDAGQEGIGYITAHYKNGYSTVGVIVLPGPTAYSIDITAEPSSIAIGETAKVTATVTMNGKPVTSGDVVFSIFFGNDKGQVSPTRVPLVSSSKTEEVMSSKDLVENKSFVNVGSHIMELVSVTVQTDAGVLDYTANSTVDPDESSKIWIDPFEYFTYYVRVTYITGGQASTEFRGFAGTVDVAGIDNPVQIRAVYGGMDALYRMSITDPIDSTNEPSMSVEAVPPTVNWGRSIGYTSYLRTVVSGYGDVPIEDQEVRYEIIYPPAGDPTRGYLDTDSLSTEFAPVAMTEFLTPTQNEQNEFVQVSTKYPIVDVVSVKQNGIAVLPGWRFEGKNILFDDTLIGAPVEVTYHYGGVCTNIYFAPVTAATVDVTIHVSTSVPYQVTENNALTDKVKEILIPVVISVGGGTTEDQGDPTLSATADTTSVKAQAVGVDDWERRSRVLVTLNDTKNRPLLGETITVEFVSRSATLSSYGTLVSPDGQSSGSSITFDTRTLTGTGAKPQSQSPATARPDWEFQQDGCSVSLQQNTTGHGEGHPPTYELESFFSVNYGIVDVLYVKEYLVGTEYAGEIVGIGNTVYLNPHLAVGQVSCAYKYGGAVFEFYAPPGNGTVQILISHYGGWDPEVNRPDAQRRQTVQMAFTVGRGDLPPLGPLDYQLAINPMRSTLANNRVGRLPHEVSTPILLTLGDNQGDGLLGETITLTLEGCGGLSSYAPTTTTVTRDGEAPVDPYPEDELPEWTYWEESQISNNGGNSEISLNYPPIATNPIVAIRVGTGSDWQVYYGGFSLDGKTLRLSQTFSTGTRTAVSYKFSGVVVTYTGEIDCVGHITAAYQDVAVDCWITCGHGLEDPGKPVVTITPMRSMLQPHIAGYSSWEYSTPVLVTLSNSWGYALGGTVAIERTCGTGLPESTTVAMGTMTREGEPPPDPIPADQLPDWTYQEEVTPEVDGTHIRKLNVQYPIISVLEVRHDGNVIDVGSFEGKTIFLNEELPDASSCLVDYEYNGGVFTFTAPSRNVDEVDHLVASFSDVFTGCDIQIGEGDDDDPTSGASLSVSADPGSVKHGPTSDTRPIEDLQSTITVELTADDNLSGKTVQLELFPKIGSLAHSAISLGEGSAELAEICSISSDLYSTSTSKNISRVTSVISESGEGAPIAGYSYHGRTIRFTSQRPNGAPVQVTYWPYGIGTTTYTAPNYEKDTTVWVEGTVGFSNSAGTVTLRNGCEIKVGDAGSSGGNLKIELEPDWNEAKQQDYPTTIGRNSSTRLRVQVTREYGDEGSEPGEDIAIELSIAGGENITRDPKTGEDVSNPKAAVGTISTASGTTDSEGYLRFSYNSANALGQDTITAKIKGASGQSATINVSVSTEGSAKGAYTYTFKVGSVSGALDPNAYEGVQMVETSPMFAKVTDFGALSDADAHGGVDFAPDNYPAIIHVSGPQGCIPMPYQTRMFTVTVTGGEWVQDSSGDPWGSNEDSFGMPNWLFNKSLAQVRGSFEMDLGGGYSYYVKVPWLYQPNSKQIDFSINIADTTGSKVQGAQVSVQGQTRTTDANGKVTFDDLPEGTHKLSISAPGYHANSQPDEYVANATWDTDDRNDYITVPPHSRADRTLVKTPFTIEVTVEVTSSFYYSGYESPEGQQPTGGGEGTP